MQRSRRILRGDSRRVGVGFGAVFFGEKSKVGLDVGIVGVRVKKCGKVRAGVGEELLGDERDGSDGAFDVEKIHERHSGHA
jgi:hypothetical protein